MLAFSLGFLNESKTVFAMSPGDFGCNSDDDCTPNPGGEAHCCVIDGGGSHMCASTGGGPYCYGYEYQYQTPYDYETPYSYQTPYDYETPYSYQTPYTYQNPYSYEYQTPAFSLTVTKQKGGIVKSGDSLINCGLNCYTTYSSGQAVTLRAYPSSSYWKFTGWGVGDCVSFGTNPLCTLNMNANKTARASFVPRLFKYREF
jgi:hypothetical protein